jgi:hypothetical protein
VTIAILSSLAAAAPPVLAAEESLDEPEPEEHAASPNTPAAMRVVTLSAFM